MAALTSGSEIECLRGGSAMTSCRILSNGVAHSKNVRWPCAPLRSREFKTRYTHKSGCVVLLAGLKPNWVSGNASSTARIRCFFKTTSYT